LYALLEEAAAAAGQGHEGRESLAVKKAEVEAFLE
jgi:hypothetical protein